MKASERLRDTGFMTESPREGYVAAIRKARDQKQLLAAIGRVRDLADDAWWQAKAVEWKAWEWARNHARDDEHAVRVMATAGCILMPAVLTQIDITANHFKAPWGVALHRLVETGVIVQHGDVFRLSAGFDLRDNPQPAEDKDA